MTAREDVVLARDQLDLVVLATALAVHRRPQIRDRPLRSGPSRAAGTLAVIETSRSVDVRRGDPGRGRPRPWSPPARTQSVPQRRSRCRSSSVRAIVQVVAEAGLSRTAASDAGAMAPGRRIRGGPPVQSTTVEAEPPGAGPPSRMSARSPASPAARRRPRRRCLRLAPTVRRRSPGAGRRPRPAPGARRGPAAACRSSAAPPVRAAGARIGALRDDQGQAAGPERRGEDVRGRVQLADLGRLVMVRDEQHDPLLERPALRREQPLDAAGRVERDGDAVDGVGRQGHEPAALERLDAAARPAASSGTTDRRAPLIGHASGDRLAARREAFDVRAAPRRPARTSASITWAAPSSATGGATYRRGRGPRRRGRHRHAVPGRGDHLEVVPLVADREGLLEGIPSRRASQRTARPLETPGATNSRNSRVAHRDLGPAGEFGPGLVERASSGTPASPTARTFVTGWRIQRSRSGTISARAPEERRVVAGLRVAGPDDEPLEVVDVGVEAVVPRPGDRLAGHRRRERAVVDEPAEPASRAAASRGRARPGRRRSGRAARASRRTAGRSRPSGR